LQFTILYFHLFIQFTHKEQIYAAAKTFLSALLSIF